MAWYRSTPPVLGLRREVQNYRRENLEELERGGSTRWMPLRPDEPVFRIRMVRGGRDFFFLFAAVGSSYRRGPRRITNLRVYREEFRVAEDALERYELYLGEDAPPDLSDSTQPVDTSPTLPFSYPLNLPSSGQETEYYALTAYRNRFGLLSFNQHPRLITINDTGEEDPGVLSPPTIRRVLDDAVGTISVYSLYAYGVDRNEADAWEVYVKDGADPVPGVDSPVASGTLTRLGGDYQWKATISESWFSPGMTLHVLSVVYRTDSLDDTLGESEVVEHVLADTVDLDPLTAGIY